MGGDIGDFFGRGFALGHLRSDVSDLRHEVIDVLHGDGFERMDFGRHTVLGRDVGVALHRVRRGDA